MSIKHKYTLKVSYSNLGDEATVSKTLTGCVVGQPLVVGVSTTHGGDYAVAFKVVSGSNIGQTQGHYHRLGTYYSVSGGHMDECSSPSCVIVPTATSVTFSFRDLDGNETVYIYAT